jgi:predicted phosphodiesterase
VENAQRAADALKEHGYPQAAADALGVATNTFSRWVKRAARMGLLGTNPVLPGFEISKTTLTPNGGEFVTQRPERVPGEAVPEHLEQTGLSRYTDGQGNVIGQWELYRKDRSIVTDLVPVLAKAFEEYQGRSVLVDRVGAFNEDLLSVYPIADQHHGLLAWGKESGEDYDLKISAERLRNSMTRLIGQSPRSQTGIILNLGDWQHTDDQKNMTPGHGNILDVDSRYFKILSAGVHLMMDCVHLGLQQHENVIVRNLPGNHDPHASIALTIALGSYFHNNPRVTVLQDPSEFFYYRFGKTLIGATHGHKMKPEVMAMNMAVTQRKDWGETDYHWFLFGHIHHETVKECGDVRVESFQTLAAKDAFSASHGYTAGQSLSSITIHSEDGEIGRHRVNIQPPDTREKHEVN